MASDVLGASGRAMLEALIAGECDGAALAELAKGKLRRKRSALAPALTGRLRPHHAFLLTQLIAHVDQLSAHIAACDEQVEELLRPLAAHRDRLQTIPGVGRRTAEVILAEIGPDMTPFPSAPHLASWAGLCPGHHESAGRRQSGKTRKGSRWLRAALVEASWSAGRTRNTYMAHFKARLSSRRGRKRAAVAVAHKILIAAWHVLHGGTAYQDLGPDYFDRLHHQRLAGYHLRRLKQLGLTVTIEHDERAA